MGTEGGGGGHVSLAPQGCPMLGQIRLVDTGRMK